MKMKELWIQKAFKKKKKGSLSRMLEIPEKDNIPFTLLEKIRVTDIGKTIKNPTKTGKKKIKITRLLKRRSVAALNVKRIK